MFLPSICLNTQGDPGPVGVKGDSGVKGEPVSMHSVSYPHWFCKAICLCCDIALLVIFCTGRLLYRVWWVLLVLLVLLVRRAREAKLVSRDLLDLPVCVDKE